ncbi:apolipoprotein N-acyltransferase [Pseudonocardia sp. TRM90224]|uniref:apolipoprotein N-acyltransferase n=1 Tax=Pseudonocardia sp. TRM90224 TaxID=2812678 RepID=UPI001E45068B|nr:apolipoprotein N-acyltransferase [Pseudonocardia sp. TRM90224]
MAAPTVDPAAPNPDPAPPDPPSPAGRNRLSLLVVNVLAAAGGGVLLYLSFPPRTTWWLALPAFALLGIVLTGRRLRPAFGYGFLFAMGFMVPMLHWVSSLVQTLPWIALSVFESLFIAATAVLIALVSRLPAAPVWMAAVWIIGEAVRGRIPFGGMPWGRIGLGQPDGPLLPVAAIGGVPLLSFVTVVAGLALGELVRRLVQRKPLRAAAVPALIGVVAMLTGPLAALVPATGPTGRTVTIAAVQGNVPRLGLDFNAQRRAVLDNHVKVTEKLAADVAAGLTPKPDLVIWPENSSDIDPLQNADAAAQLDRAAAAVGVPILVGSVLRNPDGKTTTNSALVWAPGQGMIERNDKRRIQPFGEYMPWRDFFRMFSPYVDRAGFFVPGTGTGAVDMAGVRVGVAICWEVAFDDAVAESVDAGAQVLAVPSNNATFGFTEMTFQQMAISRVRSVEHDRTSIIATTSGVSAIIQPDGTVTASTKQFTPDVLVDRTVLRDTTTLASRLRTGPEWALVAIGVLAIGFAVVGRRRQRQAPQVQQARSSGDQHG